MSKKQQFEVRLCDDNTLDEIVGLNVNFHLEKMAFNQWWMRISDPENEDREIHVWLCSSRCKIQATYDEDSALRDTRTLPEKSRKSKENVDF